MCLEGWDVSCGNGGVNELLFSKSFVKLDWVIVFLLCRNCCFSMFLVFRLNLVLEEVQIWLFQIFSGIFVFSFGVAMQREEREGRRKGGNNGRRSGKGKRKKSKIEWLLLGNKKVKYFPPEKEKWTFFVGEKKNQMAFVKKKRRRNNV